MIHQAQVTDFLNDCIASDEIFVVDVAVSESPVKQKVTIVLDSDTGIGIDECAKISRCVGRKLEEDTPEDYAFTLEVTSPGADQPIKLRRQYPRHVGRTFEITVADGSKKTGVLEGVTDEGLNLLEQVKEGKKITTVPVHIPFDEVVKAQIVISFK